MRRDGGRPGYRRYVWSRGWRRYRLGLFQHQVGGGREQGVIVFFLEWLEAGVIRTPQDIERQLDLTVVGAIPSSR